MSPLDALRVATRAIIANGLRSILTTLGMVIGVGSVIVLIAVGQGANEGVRNQIKGLGTNLVFIKPGAAPASANAGARGAQGSAITLTKSDADALAAAGIPGVAGVAPQISIDVQVINGPANQGVTLIGTTPEYPTVRGSAVAEGTFLNASDVDRKALTVVLGSNVAKTLFPDGGASNSVIRVALAGGRISFNFNVAGVMAAKGGSGGGVQDDYIFVPVTTLQNRIGFVRNPSGETNVNQINVQTTEGANQKAVQAAITNLLVSRHAVSEPDFTVQSQDDLVGAAGEVARTLSILLGSIAGISLVVGGIGVMNIMLVSVTERTREIGIRRAVGARRSDIVMQFVTEALALCIGGGLLGITIGVGVAVGINNREIAGQVMTTVIQPWSVGVAFAVAAGIGAASGSYPAFRASRLDPIAALRNE
jgi:putative ABC transport system permease protein